MNLPRISFRRHKRRFVNLSLAAKGVLAVAIPVCALLVAMIAFQQFERQAFVTQERIKQAFEVRTKTRQVGALMAHAEPGVRAYLLTQQSQYLKPFMDARNSLSAPLAELRQLVSDDADQMVRFNRVNTQIAESLQIMEQMHREAAAGRTDAALMLLDRSQAAIDNLEAELSAMRDAEDQILLQWGTRAGVAERRLRVAIIVGGLTGLIGGLLSILFLMQSVRHRLNRLRNDAHLVAQGLPIESPPTGGDEITAVERELRETSELLAGKTGELRAAHADLESRVGQRTTELSTAIENLRQTNEVLEAVVGSAPLGIRVLDLNGNITFWNPGAERIFGWTEAEVIGRSVPMIPVDQDEEQREWIDKFRTGWSVSGVERKRRRKDGSLIDVVIWTAPLRDAEGQIRGTVIVDSDVSEHRLLEEQFRQSQKLEAVGRLAGGVAHDFNNLLTVISGYSEMLIAEAKEPSRLSEYAREIQQAAGRATSLTGQLLTFSRRQRSQPRLLSLNDVIANSVRLLRRVIGEDIEVITHLDPDLGRVNADPVHIDQVIMNLVVNARDAMPNGGELVIETANAWLDQDYADHHIGVTPGAYCMLSITDTGIGMSDETRSRIFEPFFTTKEAGKGTGLGLSIVYGIVKQNNGEIVVYSELGKGTTFKIFLPMVEAEMDLVPPEPGTIAESGNETILVCEDEPIIRRLVETMLSRHGYRILEADTPHRAIELLREFKDPVHLLLTDVVLPQMSGFDLAHEARAIRPDIKVIYMSGYTGARVRSTWGVDENVPLVEKPFTSSGLARQVRQVLSRNGATGQS